MIPNNVWQISFDIQLQIQSVTWRFQKHKRKVNQHLHSLLKCHLHVTCLGVRVISISNMSIDVWFFSSRVTLHVKLYIMRVNRRAFHFCASFACQMSNTHTDSQWREDVAVGMCKPNPTQGINYSGEIWATLPLPQLPLLVERLTPGSTPKVHHTYAMPCLASEFHKQISGYRKYRTVLVD